MFKVSIKMQIFNAEPKNGATGPFSTQTIYYKAFLSFLAFDPWSLRLYTISEIVNFTLNFTDSFFI